VGFLQEKYRRKSQKIAKNPDKRKNEIFVKAEKDSFKRLTLFLERNTIKSVITLYIDV